MEVVLLEPQIPQNTGSIARTCAATNTPLRLVGKLGFDISEKAVRRAGLDYWPFVSIAQFGSWNEYISVCHPRKIWLFSKFAQRAYYTADFKRGDALVFGNEIQGLGEKFMEQFAKEQALLIPMENPNVRSLNLSNAVSIALYEAIRQQAAGQNHD